MEAKHIKYSDTKTLEINDGVKLSILLRSSGISTEEAMEKLIEKYPGQEVVGPSLD